MAELFEEASAVGDKDDDHTLPFFRVAKLKSKVHMASPQRVFPWVQLLVCQRDWTIDCKRTIDVHLIATVLSNPPHFGVHAYIISKFTLSVGPSDGNRAPSPSLTLEGVSDVIPVPDEISRESHADTSFSRSGRGILISPSHNARLFYAFHAAPLADSIAFVPVTSLADILDPKCTITEVTLERYCGAVVVCSQAYAGDQFTMMIRYFD